MAACTSNLIERDLKCIWHPFVQILPTPIPITKGQGAYLIAEDGTRYLDAISSWWVNLHGHNHPYIAQKINAQLQALDQVIFADFTHEPAINLAEQLCNLLNMDKVFYTDNGATAVEAALKMALQYWYNQNIEKKTIVCFQHSYHGDTFGAMSVSEKHLFSKPFWSHLFHVEMITPPLPGQEQESLEQLQTLIKNHDIACFIFEPLILGVGGMYTYSPQSLDTLLSLCKQHNILTIADEVMTGFGRTGPLFACDYLTQSPDMICLSKGITGGFLPLGAVACTEQIFDAFDNQNKIFLHGHSYTANPIACAAALASLDLLKESTSQRQMITEHHLQFQQAHQNHPSLIRCETLGTILALEYRSNETSSYFNPLRSRLYKYFIDNHILLRPFGNVLHVVPPYCITSHELNHIYSHIQKTL